MTFLAWKEEEKFSRIVTTEEIARTDYNISPSRHVHVKDAEEYRPMGEIVEDLDLLEAEAAEATAGLKAILGTLRINKFFTGGMRSEPQRQSEIGPIPLSWDVVPLGEVLKLAQYGLSVKGANAGNYPMLRMTNQVNGKIVANNLQWVQISEDEFNKFALGRGDILFNRTNSFDLVGRTAIFDLEGSYVFASYLIRLRVDRERLNPFFLNHYFNSDPTQQRLKSIATRAVSQSNISATRLKGFAIPLPNLDEQNEIISALDHIHSNLEVFEQRCTALRELFRTLLDQLMTAKIRINDLDLGKLVH